MNTPFANTLYYGDCLDIMAGFPDNYIDLICLDPPFNSDSLASVNIGVHVESNVLQGDTKSRTSCRDTLYSTNLLQIRNTLSFNSTRRISDVR